MTADSANPNIGKDLALWTSVLVAPAIWALQLQVGYALAPATCNFGTEIPLYLFDIVCIVLAGLAVVPSFFQWKNAGGGSPDSTEGGTNARRRFLGALGIIVSITFTTVIVAQALATLFFSPCWS
jgi:hypothetical protein